MPQELLALPDPPPINEMILNGTLRFGRKFSKETEQYCWLKQSPSLERQLFRGDGHEKFNGFEAIYTRNWKTAHRGLILFYTSRKITQLSIHLAVDNNLDLKSIPRGALVGAADLFDTYNLLGLEEVYVGKLLNGGYDSSCVRAMKWGFMFRNVQRFPEPISFHPKLTGPVQWIKVPIDLVRPALKKVGLLDLARAA